MASASNEPAVGERQPLGDTDWLHVKTANGLCYYVNNKTHVTSWDKPAELADATADATGDAAGDATGDVPRAAQIEIARAAIERLGLPPTAPYEPETEKRLGIDEEFCRIPAESRAEIFEAARKLILKGRDTEPGSLADLSETLKTLAVKPTSRVDELIELHLREERWKRLLAEEPEAVREVLSGAVAAAQSALVDEFKQLAPSLKNLLKRHLIPFILKRNPWERWCHTAEACSLFLAKLEDAEFVADMTREPQLEAFRTYLQQALLERNCELLEMTSLHHPADVGAVVKPSEVRRQLAAKLSEEDLAQPAEAARAAEDLDYATDPDDKAAAAAVPSADEAADAASAGHKFPSWCMLCREKKIWRDCAAYLDDAAVGDLVSDAFQELCQEWWAKKDAGRSSSAGEEVMDGDVDAPARKAPDEPLKVPLHLVELQQQRRRKNKKRNRRFSFDAERRRRRGNGRPQSQDWRSYDREPRGAAWPERYDRRYNDSYRRPEPARWRDGSRDRYYDDRWRSDARRAPRRDEWRDDRRRDDFRRDDRGDARVDLRGDARGDVRGDARGDARGEPWEGRRDWRRSEDDYGAGSAPGAEAVDHARRRAEPEEPPRYARGAPRYNDGRDYRPSYRTGSERY